VASEVRMQRQAKMRGGARGVVQQQASVQEAEKEGVQAGVATVEPSGRVRAVHRKCQYGDKRAGSSK